MHRFIQANLTWLPVRLLTPWIKRSSFSILKFSLASPVAQLTSPLRITVRQEATCIRRAARGNITELYTGMW